MPSTLSAQEWVELAGVEDAELLCSMYLPLDSTGVDQRTKKLQLKNALQRLRTALSAKAWEDEKSQGLLTALEGLDQHEHFLDPSSLGLAVLVPASKPRDMRVYALDFQPEESLTLGERYSIVPLLRMFGSSQPRTVLAVAEGGLRLLKGTAHHLQPMVIPETFPKDRDEVTRFESAAGQDRGDTTQHRTAPGGGGGGGVTYHGQGAKESVEMEFTRRYFRAVGEALSGILSEHETILLAGVHEQLASFRRINPELPLIEDELHGNFQHVPTEELREKALEVLQKVERAENMQLVSETRELGTDWWSTSLDDVEGAALSGRVHILFVNAASLSLPRMEDVVLEVLRHAGQVKMLEIDTLDTPCLARYRWSSNPVDSSVPV